MITAPYTKGNGFDPLLKKMIGDIGNHITNLDDDWLWVAFGDTGTGKSALMLHILQEYLGDRAEIGLVGFNRESTAEALHHCDKMDMPRGWINDEANISKRDSATKFNKSIIDLYFTIRGRQMLHLWCNPSLDMLDKVFIEERIKGVFFCPSKEPKVRVYYYFRKRDILNIFEKYKSLKLPLIKKVCKKYAYIKGWYRKYDGRLFTAYLRKKDERMSEKIQEFRDMWGEQAGGLTPTHVAESIGVVYGTVKNYIREMIKEGKLIKDKDYVESLTGKKKFFPSSLDKFKEEVKSRAERGINFTKRIKKGSKKKIK